MSGKQQQGGAQSWPHSVAGAVAGTAAVLMLHPFDVIKTRLQVQDGHQGALLGEYRGPVHAVRTILQREGWRAFYNGLVPAVLGSGIAWSAYFTAYEAIKTLHCRWHGVTEGQRLPAYSNTLSAAQAGAMVCLLTNPIWVIKTRLQLQKPTLLTRPPRGMSAGPPHAGAAPQAGSIPPPANPTGTGRQYKGFIDALIRIGREEGLAGYYKGLGPSLLLQTTHGAVQFTVYEEAKHWLRKHNWGRSVADTAGTGRTTDLDQQQQRQLSAVETSVAAGLSKLTASIITYPTQVVRSRLQQRFDLGRTLAYTNTWQVITMTWQREGLRGFYKGLGPALVRVLPQSALTLVVYEQVLHSLQQHQLLQQDQ